MNFRKAEIAFGYGQFYPMIREKISWSNTLEMANLWELLPEIAIAFVGYSGAHPGRK
jgi:hypothetical protein